jgi:hypothetical protein
MPVSYTADGEIMLGGMLFPLVKEQGGAPGRLQVQEVGGTFPRKITIGDPTKDSQDFLSTWIISDLSGGHGLSNHQTDATVNRYRYATMDVTRPNMWTQRPKVNEETGTAAAFWPLGDLLVGGTINFYGAFGTDLHVWNESTDAWTDTTRNLGSVAVDTGVAYAGTGTLRLFIPRGANGYSTDTGAALVDVAASGSVPAVRAFAIFGTLLIALSTTNQLWYTSDGTTWTSYGTDGKVDGSVTAYGIDTIRDVMGNPTLAVNTSGGVWVFDPAGPTLYRQDLQYPMHPDQGLAAVDWRGIYYVSVGMGIHSWNPATGTIDAVGLDRDEGLPYLYNYNCKIVDMAGGYNEMYALVQGSSGDSTRSSVHKFTGFGWHAVWEAASSITMTRLVVSQANSTYRVWWGGGNTSYTIELPLGYTNLKQIATSGSGTLLTKPGYIETGLNDMGMAGYRKIAHSAQFRIAMPQNDTNGPSAPQLYYRLKEGGAYVEMVDASGLVWPAGSGSLDWLTAHFWFDSNKTGIAFDEIELKLVVNNIYGVVGYLTMDFVKVPRTNKAWTATLDLSEAYDDESPATMAAKLEDLIASEAFTTMVHRNDTYYVRLASWSGPDNTGLGDERSMRTIQIIETRFQSGTET